MWGSSRSARMMREQGMVARANWKRRAILFVSLMNLSSMAYFMYFLTDKRIEALGGSNGEYDVARTFVYVSVGLFSVLFLYIMYLTGWGVPEEYEGRGVLFQLMILAALGTMALSYAV